MHSERSRIGIFEFIKKMLAEEEKLEPRHQLYYGRELFYHQKYQETADVLEAFSGRAGYMDLRIA